MKLSWIRRLLFREMQGGTLLISMDTCRQHCEALTRGVEVQVESACLSIALLRVTSFAWRLTHCVQGFHVIFKATSPTAGANVQYMGVFSTHPGAPSREAMSASVRNGYFTGAFLSRLRAQGKTTDIRLLIGSVRDDVMEATGGRQQPHIAGSLDGSICLVVPSQVTTHVPELVRQRVGVPSAILWVGSPSP